MIYYHDLYIVNAIADLELTQSPIAVSRIRIIAKLAYV